MGCDLSERFIKGMILKLKMVRVHIDTNLVNQTFDVVDYDELVKKYLIVYNKVAEPNKTDLDEAKGKLDTLRVEVCGDKLYASHTIRGDEENNGLLREVLSKK